MDIVIAAVQSGLASLASYLAAHVLLCLVPPFALLALLILALWRDMPVRA